jgi:putative transposase
MLNYASTLDRLIAFSHYVKRRYAYYQSKTHNKQGVTFERMYRSKPVGQDVYLLECARYIERNPLRAGMVEKLEKYHYSSYQFYASGIKSNLITFSPAYLDLANNKIDRCRLYINYVTQARPQEEFAQLSSVGL